MIGKIALMMLVAVSRLDQEHASEMDPGYPRIEESYQLDCK